MRLCFNGLRTIILQFADAVLCSTAKGESRLGDLWMYDVANDIWETIDAKNRDIVKPRDQVCTFYLTTTVARAFALTTIFRRSRASFNCR
jgi:hypothetical protein